MSNKQVGRQLVTRRPPIFANLTVRGTSWNEDDATKASQEMNEDEETFNVTMYDRGDDVKFDAFPDADYEPAVGDVITEQWNPSNGAQPGGWTPRSWVLVNPLTRKQFGSRALLFSFTAIRRAALDTSQVS